MRDISATLSTLSITRGRQQISAIARRARRALVDDWHAGRFFPGALVVLLAAGVFALLYYANHPQPEIYPDTNTYLEVTQRIIAQGDLLSDERMAGYPLFVGVIFRITGMGNLSAVSIAQCVLFVLAVVEIYALAYLVLQRAWMAVVASLLIGTNVYLLAAVKPILSESLALWLIVTLTLAIALCVHTLRARDWWIVTALLLAAFFTRAEWMFLALPLFAYLLFLAARRGRLRALLPHAVAATLIIYSVVMGYAALTASRYGFFGVTDKRPVQLLGKVMQYHMQSEAPASYAHVAQIVNGYVAQGIYNPAIVLDQQPELSAYYFRLADAYSTAIVERHPVQFLRDSVLFAWRFLPRTSGYYPNARINTHGPFASVLLAFQWIAALLFRSYQLFPFVALLWIVLLFLRGRTARLLTVEIMGAVILVSLYNIAVSAVATYSYDDATRVQSAVDPLLTLILFGTAVLGVIALKRKLPEFVNLLRQHTSRASLARGENAVDSMRSVPDKEEIESTS